MAWTDDTVLEAQSGDLVPQLAALGLDAEVSRVMADHGNAARARTLLNKINDWMSTRGMPALTMAALERYVTERVVAGALQALAPQGTPASRLAAPAQFGVVDGRLAWSNVDGAARWLVVCVHNGVVKREHVAVRSIPITTIVTIMGAHPGDSLRLAVAARDSEETLGWFAVPVTYTVPSQANVSVPDGD